MASYPPWPYASTTLEGLSRQSHLGAVSRAYLFTRRIRLRFVFISDFYRLLNCEGAGCAQGSVGTFMFTPIAWLSSLLTWLVVRAVFSPKYFPHLSEQQEHDRA